MPASDSSNSQVKRSLTHEGWLWLGLVVFLWLIGAFKGINLLAFLAAMMLAALLVNMLAATRGVRSLRLRRWVDQELFAGSPAHIEVEVENLRPGAVHGIRLEERGPNHCLTWYLPRVNGRTRERRSAAVALPRRGRYIWEPLQAVCGAPFGLVEARCGAEAAEQRIVYPRLGRLRHALFRRFLTQAAPLLGQARRLRPAPHPSAQNELHGVRQFRSSDSPRHIHWPTSARRGELIVREFEDTPSENLLVILDPHAPNRPNGARQAKDADDEALERAIRMTATICWEWCRLPGNHLALAVAGGNPEVLASMSGEKLSHSILERLALQEGESAPDPISMLARLRETDIPSGATLLISTRPVSFVDRIATSLGRPVAFISTLHGDDYEFYERPANAS